MDENAATSLQVFTVVTAVLATFTVTLRCFEILNGLRDVILTGEKNGSTIEPRLRQLMLDNDWRPMHRGLVWFLFIVTIAFVAVPLVGGSSVNVTAHVTSYCSAALAVFAFVSFFIGQEVDDRRMRRALGLTPCGESTANRRIPCGDLVAWNASSSLKWSTDFRGVVRLSKVP